MQKFIKVIITEARSPVIKIEIFMIIENNKKNQNLWFWFLIENVKNNNTGRYILAIKLPTTYSSLKKLVNLTKLLDSISYPVKFLPFINWKKVSKITIIKIIEDIWTNFFNFW